jgi:hypothetical protein
MQEKLMSYESFLQRKRQLAGDGGFEPLWMPDFLFPFQAYATQWAIRRGRAALIEDCGLGKTPQEFVWAQNVVMHTNKRVLVLTPLAVVRQAIREAEKFGIEASVSRDGSLNGKIIVTNYEQLHRFDAADFVGVVCDEASILKSFTGPTRKRVTRFMSKMAYRLLATATAAPNDYVELGTLSEALGELSYSDMLRRFFCQLDDKGQKRETKRQEEAERLIEADPNYFRKLAYRVAQTIGQWRLKHHAVQPFWRWVASWSRAFRMPSDLGFSDDAFVLPELVEHDHIIVPKSPPPGMLFNLPAFGMHEERKERRRTLDERCAAVSELVRHNEQAVVWCDLNDEADLLEKTIGDSRQVAGRMSEDEKIEVYESFIGGSLRVLVIKPKIAAYGSNWQHCHRIVSFASHSWERYYQLVRRCWRFGQKAAVRHDVVCTEGEIRVLANMRRKGAKATAMFESLIREMNNASTIERETPYTRAVEVPTWL